jgi:hypothetical protein
MELGTERPKLWINNASIVSEPAMLAKDFNLGRIQFDGKSSLKIMG